MSDALDATGEGLAGAGRWRTWDQYWRGRSYSVGGAPRDMDTTDPVADLISVMTPAATEALMM